MYIPIRVCSFRKTGIESGYLKDHYNSNMLVVFFKKFKNHAILSKKYGICLSGIVYKSYGDDEMLKDEELLFLLKEQAKEYAGKTFLYWNHRPTHEKWVAMMKEAGFDVVPCRTLAEIDSIMNPKLADFVKSR